jgi:O-antigen ligase
MEAPQLQEMVQGEGIIDIVNSYVGVALAHGLVGLALFAGAFAFAVWQTWTAMRACRNDAEAHAIGRALLACMASVVVMIATVSSIAAIPMLYWMLAGMCVAYARFAAKRSGAATAGSRAHGRTALPPAWQARR